MSRTRWALRLLIAGSVLLVSVPFGAGCSSLTSRGGRVAGTNGGPKTFLSVGDRPLPVVTGTPGSSVVAADPAPTAPRVGASRNRSVSGRVFDDAGEPVAGATVRLAVDGSRRGRSVQAVSDASGGFTLHGLRPGTSYTVIAESDGGPLGPLTGRVEAQAAATELRITLAPRDASAARTPASVPLSRVSDRAGAADDAEDADPILPPDPGAPTGRAERPKLNEEDLPPAVEAEALGPDGTPPSQPKARRAGGGSWRAPGSPTASHPPTTSQTTEYVTRPAEAAFDPEAIGTGAPSEEPGEAPDEGPNPLPPALERPPGQAPPSDATASRPTGTHRPLVEPLEASAGPRRRTDLDSPSRPTTVPAPHEVADAAPGSKVVVPEAFTPVVIEEDPFAPDPTPVAALPPERPRPVAAVAHRTSGRPRASLRRPTWGEVTAQAGAFPPLETTPAGAGEGAPARTVAPAAASPEETASPGETAGLLPDWVRDPKPVVPPSEDHPETAATATAAATDTPAIDASALCDYDDQRRRLRDFRLPDLKGKPVHFRDIDADLVLLDFWGTWCGPCLKSVPRLVELQHRYPGKRLAIVGIACEPGPPESESPRVAATAEKLKVNYEVLLSRNDGSCPVQQALHVQAYPTLVLLDREGRVLWRDQGATPATMTRLNRVLASMPAAVDTARR